MQARLIPGSGSLSREVGYDELIKGGEEAC